MEPNKQLAIVIPTYNRAEFLDYSLEVHIPICKYYNIQIFISDNASTDSTKEIVEKWKQQYEYLYYSTNLTNIGAIANFKKAFKMPDTDYVWLLGDTYQIEQKALEYVLLNITKAKYDVVVLNLDSKLQIGTKDYYDSNELLYDLGALMTCAAVSVFNKDLIRRANFSKYYNSWFIQTGIIFEDIADKNFCIHWVSEYSIKGLKHPTLKKTRWTNTLKAFEIGCEDWINFVMSLPTSYKLENKIKCIMDFGKVSGLFNFRGLVRLRVQDLLNIGVFNKYKKLFSLTIDYPIWVIYIVTIFPKSILYFLAKSYKSLIERKRLKN